MPAIYFEITLSIYLSCDPYKPHKRQLGLKISARPSNTHSLSSQFIFSSERSYSKLLASNFSCIERYRDKMTAEQ